VVAVDCGPLGTLSGMAGAAGIGSGDPVVVALRPEKMRLRAGGEPAGGGTLAGRVAEASFLGDRIHYQIAVPGLDRQVAVFVNNAEDAPAHALNAPVALDCPPSAALVLPA